MVKNDSDSKNDPAKREDHRPPGIEKAYRAYNLIREVLDLLEEINRLIDDSSEKALLTKIYNNTTDLAAGYVKKLGLLF